MNAKGYQAEIVIDLKLQNPTYFFTHILRLHGDEQAYNPIIQFHEPGIDNIILRFRPRSHCHIITVYGKCKLFQFRRSLMCLSIIIISQTLVQVLCQKYRGRVPKQVRTY